MWVDYKIHHDWQRELSGNPDDFGTKKELYTYCVHVFYMVYFFVLKIKQLYNVYGICHSALDAEYTCI